MIRDQIICALVLSVILGGCAPATPEPNLTAAPVPTLTATPELTLTATPEPTATKIPKPATCADVNEPCFEVVFTEDSCAVHGPSIVPGGTIYIQFHNQRDERARMGLWKLNSDRTIQAFREAVGDEPSDVHHNSSWFEVFFPAKPAGPGKIYLRDEYFNTGSYVLDCFTEDPYQLWFAGGFTVE